MGQGRRVVWATVLFAGGMGLLLVGAGGCNDERKPPLTPDGPDMTLPDAGDVPTAPTPPPTK